MMKDNADKISADNKGKLETAANEVKEALKARILRPSRRPAKTQRNLAGRFDGTLQGGR